jgi:membrane protease YdiL (CAAX protease family)
MRKILFGLVWVIIFYFGSIMLIAMVLGGVAGYRAGKEGHHERAGEAGRIAGQKFATEYGGVMFLISIVASGIGTSTGLLPWTRKKDFETASSLQPPNLSWATVPPPLPPPLNPFLIYINRDGETYGPYTLEGAKAYLSAGSLAMDDLGWHEKLEGWLPLSQIPELSAVARPPGLPWGPVKTVGLSLCILVAWFLSQSLVGFFYGLISSIKGIKHTHADYEALGQNGLFVAAAVSLSSPVLVFASILCARLKKGITIREYFGFHRVKFKVIAKWAGIFFLSMLTIPILIQVLGHQKLESDFMEKTWKSSGSLVLYIFAFVIAAPLGEEIFFRGFLFKGMLHSQLRGYGAIVICSLVWAGIHSQYHLNVIIQLFLLGIVLGFARLKTGSIYVPIALHMLLNTIAVVVTALRM